MSDQSSASSPRSEQEQFMSFVVHELRNPLAAIYGYAQLLDSKLSKNGSDQPEAKWAKSMKQECEKLNALIGELRKNYAARENS